MKKQEREILQGVIDRAREYPEKFSQGMAEKITSLAERKMQGEDVLKELQQEINNTQ